MTEGSLSGRVAVVTGVGLHRGIGAAICRALAGRGADVFFTNWSAYDAETHPGEENYPSELEGELRGVGIRAKGMEADLSRPGSPGEVLDAVAARLGPPSILVNNAAYSTRDGYEGLDAATPDAHYAVNLRATALLAVGVVRGFDAGNGGRVVNLTSGQSLGPMVGELAYAATRGAIEAFTKTLAAEVGHKGITVSAVNSGPTQPGWMSDKLEGEIASKFPGGRVGEPGTLRGLWPFSRATKQPGSPARLSTPRGAFSARREVASANDRGLP